MPGGVEEKVKETFLRIKMRSMVQLKIGYFRCFPLFVVSQLVVEKTGKNNGLHVSKDWKFACAERKVTYQKKKKKNEVLLVLFNINFLRYYWCDGN